DADVRHRRLNRHPAGAGSGRSLSAPYLLCDCALSFTRRARDDLRLICGDLLLVSQGYRKNDERILGQSAFLAVTHLHERDFPPDVSARDARHAPALVRWWPGPWRGRRSHRLGADWIPVEPTDLVGSVDNGF